ncbi:hypothetical protein JXA02_11750 [candidate division KSB1 bacterium]|nr:hypothetical protein [candidate division KSB1 bacterium]RQW02127.1 MAG: hypothetical protein EH222_14060 [candidate division KSB1 bacterium]
MTRKLFMGWLVGLGLVLLPIVSQADIYMKQKQHSDAMSMMGQTQPARDVINETWITEDKMVSNNERQKILVDMGKKSATFADHEKRTIMSMPLDFNKMMESKQGDLSTEERAEIQQLMGSMMKIKVKVQPTAEKKKINGWNCVKYIQTMEMGMGTVTSEIWTTTDINIDPDLYVKFNSAMLAQMPGVSQNMAEITQEMKKIKGVHVLSTQKTEMMGHSFGSSTELLEFKEGNAPASAFSMPTGYSKENPF